MWSNLESLYMNKSMAWRLCLKLGRKLKEVCKIINDLENIEERLMIRIRIYSHLGHYPYHLSISRIFFSYHNEDTITLDKVQTIVRFKELIMIKDLKVNDICECMNFSRG